jgi:hypothetical protein
MMRCGPYLYPVNFLTPQQVLQARKLLSSGRPETDAFPPGSAYFADWCRVDDRKTEEWCKIKDLFNDHYVNVASYTRAPLILICPNGETWSPDLRIYTNDVWRIDGDKESLSIYPNIFIKGYYGYVEDGWFSADMYYDVRGIHGISTTSMH